MRDRSPVVSGRRTREGSPRWGVRRPVRFYRVDELVHAYTDDLSETGAFVRTDAWLPINGVVDLFLGLAGEAATVVPARVVYCLPPDQARSLGRRAGIGFQFVPSRESDLLLLQHYLRELGEPWGPDGLQVPPICHRPAAVTR